jgi:hypothetical protein
MKREKLGTRIRKERLMLKQQRWYEIEAMGIHLVKSVIRNSKKEAMIGLGDLLYHIFSLNVLGYNLYNV